MRCRYVRNPAVVLRLTPLLLVLAATGDGIRLAGATSTPVATGTASGTAPSAPAVGTLPNPVAVSSVRNDPVDGHPVFSLGLNWNQSVATATVAVPNTLSYAVNILGVQGSSGVYVNSIPTSIPANGSATIQYVYVSDPGGEASSDYVKVLTSNGTIVAEIQHNRTQVAQFSANSLQWSVGAAAAPQSVTLTMTPGTAVPIGVAALGVGNKATISAGSDGQYTITVTPGSTASAETFPVVITFNPRLPGVAGTIGCTVH